MVTTMPSPTNTTSRNNPLNFFEEWLMDRGALVALSLHPVTAVLSPSSPSPRHTQRAGIQQLSEHKDTKTDRRDKQCIVCMDNERVVAPQCGHKQLCVRCARTLMEGPTIPKCPMCRTRITQIIRVFE